jgi:hypothetical protein
MERAISVSIIAGLIEQYPKTPKASEIECASVNKVAKSIAELN